MKVEYTIVALAISLVFAIVKNYLPDFPVDDSVFETVILYVLAKLGLDIVKKPAEFLRGLFK